MNKDIEDALEQIHIKLRQIGNELQAIGTQYLLNDIEVDALEQINKDLQSSIREIERLTI
jgi:hypothetical protein